jgi:hypothetical protein
VPHGAARGLDEGLIGTTVIQVSFMDSKLHICYPCRSLTDLLRIWLECYKDQNKPEIANGVGNITAMV